MSSKQQVGTSYIKNNNQALVSISSNHHFWLITIIKDYLDFAETPTSTIPIHFCPDKITKACSNCMSNNSKCFYNESRVYASRFQQEEPIVSQNQSKK